MKHILRLVNYYKNILLTITTNIFTFDVSVSIRDLHQKKYDQFFFRFWTFRKVKKQLKTKKSKKKQKRIQQTGALSFCPTWKAQPKEYPV